MPKNNVRLLTFSTIANGDVPDRRCIGFDGKVGSKKVLGVTSTPVKSGVTSTTVKSGGVVDVVTKGTAIVKAGGRIQIGDSLISDDYGNAVPTTDESDPYIFGVSLESCDDDGVCVEVLLK